MRIGITYDLKADPPSSAGHPAEEGEGLSDDFQEEFDSPATIEAIASVLRELGHEVEKLGDGRELIERLLAQPPDLVFNIAEGQGIGRSREARVPALLEMLGIPYTGSDPLTLAVTLDKACAKRLVQSVGVATPRAAIIEDSKQRPGPLQINSTTVTACNGKSLTAADLESLNIPFPVIVKPAWEGSSKGIRSTSVVDRAKDLEPVLHSLQRDQRQPLLIEEYIQGDELTVGVVGNQPPKIIGIMRVLPSRPTERFIYSLEVKRDFERQVCYDCPASLSPATTEAVRQAALAAYHILGCRDVARVDFRLRDGIPYFLEVNPLPGLNPHSGDLVIMSRHMGWTYPQLIGMILQSALDRQA